MAEFNFPPKGPGDVGDTYRAPNGMLYVWDGNAWKTVGPDNVPDLETTFVEVAGDNMTGDLTLGGDKIELDATDGFATFAGNVDTDSYFFAKSTGAVGGLYAYNFGTSARTAIRVSNTNGDAGQTIELDYDGSATFAGGVQSSGKVVVGALEIEPYTSTDGSFTMFGYNSNSVTISFNQSGSATFKGDIDIGDSEYNSPGNGGIYLGAVGGIAGCIFNYRSNEQSAQNDESSFLRCFSSEDATKSKNEKIGFRNNGSAKFAERVTTDTTFYAGNPGTNPGNQGAYLWAGDDVFKSGQLAIYSNQDNSESVINVNTAPDDSTTKTQTFSVGKNGMVQIGGVHTSEATTNLLLKPDGSGTFAGFVQSGDSSGTYSVLTAEGSIDAKVQNSTDIVFSGKYVGFSGVDSPVEIKGDGSASFASDVTANVFNVDTQNYGSRLYEGSGAYADSLVIDGAPTPGNGNIVFVTSSAERARINSNGLTVEAGITANGNIKQQSSGGYIWSYDNATGSYSTLYAEGKVEGSRINGSSSDYTFISKNNNIANFLVKADGAVEVGIQPSPTITLSADGSAVFDGTVTANGTVLTRTSGGMTIDLGDRAEKVDAALTSLKTAAAAATDFAELKSAIATALANI